jgi:hypothetical protein
MEKAPLADDATDARGGRQAVRRLATAAALKAAKSHKAAVVVSKLDRYPVTCISSAD